MTVPMTRPTTLRTPLRVIPQKDDSGPFLWPMARHQARRNNRRVGAELLATLSITKG